MGLDILVSVVAGFLSLLGAGVASSEAIQKLLRKALHREAPEKSYSERLAELTLGLSRASREVDAVLVELARVAKDRAQAVQQLEVGLATMENREKELKDRIAALENTPLAVAEHFAKLVAPGEKRSAARDYMLFGAGVVVSTIIGVVIQVFLR